MAKKNKIKLSQRNDKRENAPKVEETDTELQSDTGETEVEQEIKVEERNHSDSTKKDKAALVVSFVIVGLLAFFTYRYFNATTNLDLSNKLKENKEQVSNIISSATKRDNGEKKAAGTKQGDTTTQDSKQQAPTAEQTKEDSTFGKLNEWRATDYKKGDVNAGTDHMVQSGDTLWELAEAAYGNGNEWIRILAANSNSIGFLPSGAQALIVPGQILVIPSIS